MKNESSLDFAKNIISNESDEEILRCITRHEIEENLSWAGYGEGTTRVEPVHNGAIEYQARASKGVLENVKLNDLGVREMIVEMLTNQLLNLNTVDANIDPSSQVSKEPAPKVSKKQKKSQKKKMKAKEGIELAEKNASRLVKNMLSLPANVVGASMSKTDNNYYYVVKAFPGANLSDMEDFVSNFKSNCRFITESDDPDKGRLANYCVTLYVTLSQQLLVTFRCGDVRPNEYGTPVDERCNSGEERNYLLHFGISRSEIWTFGVDQKILKVVKPFIALKPDADIKEFHETILYVQIYRQ
ncbi:Hypothetical predicted protein [Paramuricea clavata]|uniref:Uncharacterized protein n=1 Tax=Paramuricea clavata TaxID=317549 RepID=A0A7D9I8W7_PARCT|nr:Hypothetical predicted protein [Paramuricea clavata]